MGKRGFEVSHIEFDEVNLWMVMDEALKTLKKKEFTDKSQSELVQYLEVPDWDT